MLTAGCAGTQPPPKEAPPTAVERTQKPVAVADMSPVSEPDGVVVVGRLASPKRTVETLQQWFGVPLPVGVVIDELFDTPGASAAVDLRAPVDVIVAFAPTASLRNPEAFVGVSMGFHSVKQGLDVLDEHKRAKEVRPGVYRLDVGSGDETQPCVMAPSLGVSAARLVCATSVNGLGALWPYMTRGLPTAPLGDSALQVQARMAPVRAKFGGELTSILDFAVELVTNKFSTPGTPLGTAIRDAAQEVSKQLAAFAEDLDTVRLDVKLDAASKGASVELGVQTRSQTSLGAKALADMKATTGHAPQMFWRAPPATLGSSFNYMPVNDEGRGVVRHHVLALLDGLLTDAQFAPNDRKQAAELASALIQRVPRTVSFSGYQAGADDGRPASSSTLLAALAAGKCNWHIYGMEYDVADAKAAKQLWTNYDNWAKSFVGLVNRPSVHNAMMKESGLTRAELPKLTYAVRKVPGLPGLKGFTLTVPKSMLAAFQPGHSDSHVHGVKPAGASPSKKAEVETIEVLLWAEESRVWVALGDNSVVLQNMLKTVKDNPSGSTPAALQRFRQEPYNSAGYFTLAGLLGDFGKRLAARLDAAPNKGLTPILYYFPLKTDSKQQFTVKLEVTSGTLDDTASFIRLLAQ